MYIEARVWTWAAVLGVAALVIGCDSEDGAGTGGGGAIGPGSGGGAGEGGAGEGGGGGGGGAGACLDPASHEALLSIADPGLCAVAIYTADVELGYSVSPTWGRHGGPLLALPGAAGAADLVRLTPPPGAATGALSSEQTTVDAGIPDGAYFGAQAVDLPFFDWTALSWTGAAPDTQGELILVEGAAVAKRYPVNGFYSGAGLAAVEGGRLLYTGLSPLGDPAATTNALYAADTCGAPGQDPRLLPEGDPTCAAPLAVAAWGEFSGPLVADSAGNAFAVLPTFGAPQEARGFAAAQIARGAGPTEGAPMFTLPGSGSSLAALAPSAEDPGLLFFQPSDADVFTPLDPVAVRYDATADAVQPQGQPAPALQLASAGTLVTLMADDVDRLWVGVPGPGGGTAFVVIARR
jgi:hypothetical protein